MSDETPNRIYSETGGPGHDGSLLKVIRFLGGMVLLPSLACVLALLALALDTPYGYGLELPERGFTLVMLAAILGSGFYVSLRLQEGRIATAPFPAVVRIGLGYLSAVVRLLGGWFLASMVCAPLGLLAEGSVAESVVAPIMFVVCATGAVLAVLLPMGRRRWV